MNFEELLNTYRNASEDAPIPDDFADQLEQAYRQDISVRDTAVDNHRAMVEERQREIDRLKVHNYDLLRKIPTDDPKTGNGGNAEDDEPTEYTGSIDDLFKKKG